jgi:hypothetical protein
MRAGDRRLTWPERVWWLVALLFFAFIAFFVEAARP